MGKKKTAIDAALRQAWVSAMALHDRVLMLAESVRNGATRDQLHAESDVADTVFRAVTEGTDKQAMEYFAAAHLELCRVRGRVELATFNGITSTSLYGAILAWAAGRYILFRATFDHSPHIKEALDRPPGWVDSKLVEWANEIEIPPRPVKLFSDSEFRSAAYMELVQALLVCDRIPRTQSAVSPITLENVTGRAAPPCPKCGGTMPTYKTNGRTQNRKCTTCGHTTKTLRNTK